MKYYSVNKPQKHNQMKMKGNVKQKMKQSRRLILIAGASSILVIALGWFLIYTFSGTDKTIAGKTDGISARAYIENENLIDFEVIEPRIRPADDPVVTGNAKYKEAKVLHNE